MSADQFMDAIVRNTVHTCQRYTVTAFRQNRTMETIGDRVRSLREEKQIPIRELASAAGIGTSTLSDLEHGRSKRTTHLHQIATKLGARVTYLETGRGPKWADDQVIHDETAIYDVRPPAEVEVLEIYRAMTPATQVAWLTIGRELTARVK